MVHHDHHDDGGARDEEDGCSVGPHRPQNHGAVYERDEGGFGSADLNNGEDERREHDLGSRRHNDDDEGAHCGYDCDDGGGDPQQAQQIRSRVRADDCVVGVADAGHHGRGRARFQESVEKEDAAI